MNPKDLLFAMNDLDDDLLLDAQEPAPIRTHSPRRLMTVLIAAAFVLSLAACGVAVRYFGNNLIFNYFRSGSTEGLTESQVAYLEENSQGIAQSQTVDGYTITVDSAITDGQDVYIGLTITAPEGTVLDADQYGFLDGISLISDDSASYYMGCGITLENGVLKAALSAHDIFSHGERVGSFANGKPWTLTIHGLTARYNDGGNGYWIRPTLTDGTWTFDIRFEATTDILELVTDPVITTVDNSRALNDDPFGDLSTLPPNYAEIRITSMQLRSLSLSLTYEYLSDYDLEVSCQLGNPTVVNKDGTQILLTDQTGGWDGSMSFRASAPILFSEADYLLFPDGTQVDIPER